MHETCHHCQKPLPTGARGKFCPRQIGNPRCSELASKELARREQLEKEKARAEEARIRRAAAPILSRAPAGAVGYRISKEVGASRWVSPPGGSTVHYDGFGTRHRGGNFYQLGQVPKVPSSSVYRIEYVDNSGALMSHQENVYLEQTPGTHRSPPGPASRELERNGKMGDVPERRIRIRELAAQLRIETAEVLAAAQALSIECRHANSSLTSDGAMRVVDALRASIPGLADSLELAAPPRRQTTGLPPSLVIQLQLPLPGLIAPDVGEAQEKMRTSTLLADVTEARVLQASERNLLATRDLEQHVDKLAGIHATGEDRALKGG